MKANGNREPEEVMNHEPAYHDYPGGLVAICSCCKWQSKLVANRNQAEYEFLQHVLGTHAFAITQTGLDKFEGECSCGYRYRGDDRETVGKVCKSHLEAVKTENHWVDPLRHKTTVKDPTGRVDVLLSQLISEVASKSSNPLVRDAYAMFQPEIDQLLSTHLGPKNKSLKPLRRAIKTGRALYRRHSGRYVRDESYRRSTV